jgi:plastocyanin
MTKSVLMVCLLAVTAVAALLALTACEVESAALILQISPAYVEIRQGQSVDFTATGAEGFDHFWSLDSDDGRGALSSKVGETVLYTCLRSVTGTVQTVRCRATPPNTGLSSSGTNATATFEGTATVVFR